MNLSHLLTCLSVVAVSVSAECTTNQTNTARELFKDCMDMAQANLLKINIEDEDNNIKLYCDGLEEFSSGCSAAIESFSECKSREEVNNLVAIHINSIAGTLIQRYYQKCYCSLFRVIVKTKSGSEVLSSISNI